MNTFENNLVSITLGLVALSGTVLLAGHLRSVSLERSLLEKQLVLLAERVTASKTARKQVDDAFEQREQQVKRVAKTEAQYAGLLTDLLELAKVDADARVVVQKWKIQASGDADSGAEEDTSSQTPPSTGGHSLRPTTPQAGSQKSKTGQ